MSTQGYVVHVNAERTVMVRAWDSGRMEVCTRPEPDAIWSPPTRVEPEPSYEPKAER